MIHHIAVDIHVQLHDVDHRQNSTGYQLRAVVHPSPYTSLLQFRQHQVLHNAVDLLVQHHDVDHSSDPHDHHQQTTTGYQLLAVLHPSSFFPPPHEVSATLAVLSPLVQPSIPPPRIA